MIIQYIALKSLSNKSTPQDLSLVGIASLPQDPRGWFKYFATLILSKKQFTSPNYTKQVPKNPSTFPKNGNALPFGWRAVAKTPFTFPKNESNGAKSQNTLPKIENTVPKIENALPKSKHTLPKNRHAEAKSPLSFPKRRNDGAKRPFTFTKRQITFAKQPFAFAKAESNMTAKGIAINYLVHGIHVKQISIKKPTT